MAVSGVLKEAMALSFALSECNPFRILDDRLDLRRLAIAVGCPRSCQVEKFAAEPWAACKHQTLDDNAASVQSFAAVCTWM